MISLPKTVTRQRRDCNSNPGPSPPESSTLTARLPSHLLVKQFRASVERRHTFVDVVIAGVGAVQADGDVWVSKSSVCQLHQLVVATWVRRRAGHSLLRHHLYDAIRYVMIF